MIDATRRDLVPWFFLVTFVAFWPTLFALPRHWNSYNEHGWVVAALVGWLVWRDRRRISAHAGKPLADLIPLLALGSVVWLLARVVNVDAVHQTMFGLLLFGWAVMVFGRSSLRFVGPIAATALIAAPLWDMGVPLLQRAAVIVTGLITTVGGVDAEIGAYTIGISTGVFVVETGCSGLNYLMVSLTLGAIYGHLFVEGWRTQLKVIAVAAGTALLSNWIRISALVFVGEATAMQSSLITDHLLFGWVVFTVMLVPAYVVVRRVEIRAGSTPALRADVDVDGSATPEKSTNDARRLRAARAATLATVVGPALYLVFSVLPRPVDVDRSAAVFRFSDAVEVRETASAPWTPDFQGIDARADWHVTAHDSDVPLTGSRFWFLDQAQGEELVQGSNRIASDSLTVSSQYVSAGPGGSRIVRETVLYSDGAPRVIWSWYRVAGRDTPFARNAKLLEFWAWLTRSGPSELVTVSAPCNPDSCEAAAIALREAVAPGG